jgi:hypothetical protein
MDGRNTRQLMTTALTEVDFQLFFLLFSTNQSHAAYAHNSNVAVKSIGMLKIVKLGLNLNHFKNS